MLQQIYFKDFVYKNKSVIWSYDEDSKTAQCDYRVTGERDSISPSLINPLFAHQTGIEIINDIAIIKDMSTFRILHPFNILPPLIRTNSSRSLTFYPRSADLVQRATPSSSNTSAASSVHIEPPSSPRTGRNSLLTFTTILADYPGETLVYDIDYESNLPSNNDTNLNRLLDLKIYSQTAVGLAMQVIKNIDYYILRGLQIKLVKRLFEQELIPAIYEYLKKPLTAEKKASIPDEEALKLKLIKNYFANAVRNIMGNRKYNSKDTAFEASFYEEQEPIPIQLNHEVRSAYARTMLTPLLFLVADITPPLGLSSEMEEWLKEFKEHLDLKDRNKMSSLLLTLEHLIICTGLMDHDYKRMELDTIQQHNYLNFNILIAELENLHKGSTTLHYALDRMKASLIPLKAAWEQQKEALEQQQSILEQQEPHNTEADRENLKRIKTDLINVIADLKQMDTALLETKHPLLTKTETEPLVLYSLRSIICSWFQMGLSNDIKTKLKEQGMNDLFNETMGCILTVFNDCTKGRRDCEAAQYISHTIKSGDTNIYVNPKWKADLELDFIESTRSLAAHKKNALKIEKWKTAIISSISNVLGKQLEACSQRTLLTAFQSSSAPSLLRT